jgi:glycerol-3-phosphate dehydrogenase (NAD(P)+)
VSQLAVIGAGSWGTALAVVLASRFDSVHIWTRTSTHASELAAARENHKYLPGFAFPKNVQVSADLGPVLRGAEIVLSAVPSTHVREIFCKIRPFAASAMKFVSATKGIEEGTLNRMSQVIADVLPPEFAQSIAVLSGPTFAKEVAAGEPAAVVVAAERIELADSIQQAFATSTLRFYTSHDVIGVEIGAALKNVIAIGSGICSGLGLGSNSIAALVTRGLAEITRLAVSLGGAPRTMSGLAGLGDLVLTATGDLSRNRHVGVQLGQGRSLDTILSGMTMVAEGVTTCRAAHQLGIQADVDLPIINKMHRILYESKDVRQAIRELMDRPLTSE